MPTCKWISSHLDNAVWYVDSGKRFAKEKCMASNACHTIWYIDACQRFAFGVSIIS